MNIHVKGIYRPKLYSVLRKGYNRKTFTSDLIAGIIVGIVALPLAIAFGIASGVTPQQGLITAIIAGLIISAFGGTRFLIGGPTGAFIVIVAGIIQQYGLGGLTIATIMAGVILIVMGLCKLGIVFKFIPYPIVVGFTSGIAVTLLTTQIKDFFGMDVDVPSGFIPQLGCYATHLGSIHWLELLFSICGVLIIVFWNRKFKKIPGSLIAIIVCTGASLLLSNVAGIQLNTIGSKFPELGGRLSFPKPTFPAMDFQTIRGLVSPAFTIAMLCAIESLLAATVTDGVTGHSHDGNSELIGEGIANIVTPLFGGIPATGAIARTMANINNGGKSPVSGIVHAVTLLLIYLFLMPFAIYIPLSCLAAILVVVAYNMSEWRTFLYLMKGDKQSVAVLLVTFFLTVIVDLTVAIEFGVVLAIALFLYRVMQTSNIEVIEAGRVNASENEEVNPEDTEYLAIPERVQIYEINGPYFFGLANKFEEFNEKRSTDTLVRIIRMRKVPFMDATGANNLRNLCQRMNRRGVKVVLSGVNPSVRSTLGQYGLVDVIGEENILPHISLALRRAQEITEGK